MKKSENDIIKEFVDLTGPEEAPSGFTGNLMSRIKMEKEYTYVNPIKRKFVIVVALIFTGLIILTSTLPSASEYSWMTIMMDKISGFGTGMHEYFSSQKILYLSSYVFYISAGIIVFVLFDRFLARFLIQGKESPGRV